MLVIWVIGIENPVDAGYFFAVIMSFAIHGGWLCAAIVLYIRNSWHAGLVVKQVGCASTQFPKVQPFPFLHSQV